MELFYFLSGIIFAVYLMPLLEEITIILTGCIEIIKQKQIYIITKTKTETAKLTKDTTSKSVRKIGFAAVSESEENEDEEDEV